MNTKTKTAKTESTITHCAGCGKPLKAGSSAAFHPGCDHRALVALLKSRWGSTFEFLRAHGAVAVPVSGRPTPAKEIPVAEASGPKLATARKRAKKAVAA